MKPAVSLAAYGLSLAVVFTSAWAVGSAVGPQDVITPTRADGRNGAQTANRGGTGPTPTVAPSQPSEPAPRQVQAIGGAEVTTVPSAPTPPTASHSRGGASAAGATAACPVRQPSEPHDRSGETRGHKDGRGKAAEHSRSDHHQQRRGAGHR